MKIIILGFVYLTWLNHSFARELFLSPDIVEVLSSSQHDPTSGNVVYRATVFSGGSEGAVSIGVEKFQRGEYGSPDKIILQEKMVTSNIEGFKELIDKIATKSVEATYGCCPPKNLKWSKGNTLEFDLKYENRIFDRGFTMNNDKKVDTAQYSHTEITTFNCRTASLSVSKKLKAKCKRANFEKVKKE